MLHNVLVFQQSSTYLSLTILDLPNQDPRFLNEPYSGSVPENCALVRSLPAPVACPYPWPSLGALTPQGVWATGHGGGWRCHGSCPDGRVPTGHHCAHRQCHGQRHGGE